MHSLANNIICPMWNPAIKASSAAGSLEWNKFSNPGQWSSSWRASVPSISLAPSRWVPGEPCCGNLRRCYLLFASVGRMHHWTGDHAEVATTQVTASQSAPETKKRFEQRQQTLNHSSHWKHRCVSVSVCCSVLGAAALTQVNPQKGRRNLYCYCQMHNIRKSLRKPWAELGSSMAPLTHCPPNSLNTAVTQLAI